MGPDNERDRQTAHDATLPPGDTGHESPFEQIRQTDARGDFWQARLLMPAPGYIKWQDFDVAMQRTSDGCVTPWSSSTRELDRP